MPLVEAKGITKSFGDNRILKSIDLSITAGEAFVIIGPTGAGKTTLLHILDLLEQPSSGVLQLLGTRITGSPHRYLNLRRRMAFVQQKPIAFNASFWDNIAYPLKWRRLSGAEIRTRVQSMLELIGMTEYAGRNALNLSGGETQRLAIARALVTNPEILLLDEPTANLDPVSVARIEEVLSRIIREKITTVIMSTHDMSQGQRLASKIGVMIDGEMLQIGQPSEIFNSPKHKKVADFVGIDNIISGTILEKDENLVLISLDSGGYQLQALSDCAVGERVYAITRPEDVTFFPSHEKTSARNVFYGTITRATLVGPLVRIEVDCGFPLLGLITGKSASEFGLTVGKQVYVGIKATAIHAVRMPA